MQLKGSASFAAIPCIASQMSPSQGITYTTSIIVGHVTMDLDCGQHKQSLTLSNVCNYNSRLAGYHSFLSNLF